MRPLLHGSFFVAFALLVACSQGTDPLGGAVGAGARNPGASSGSGSGSGGSSGGGSGGGSSGGSSGGQPATLDGGAATPGGGTDAGGPPPSQPPQANGFQETIAPLLDAQGCTECHHHGRSIDLTTYPFMAGAPADTASQLVASFTKGMPPAPRTAAPQSVVEAIDAWVAAGMKP